MSYQQTVGNNEVGLTSKDKEKFQADEGVSNEGLKTQRGEQVNKSQKTFMGTEMAQDAKFEHAQNPRLCAGILAEKKIVQKERLAG